jgi:ribosomal protein S18 acetylase RimI-like enzyme
MNEPFDFDIGIQEASVENAQEIADLDNLIFGEGVSKSAFETRIVNGMSFVALDGDNKIIGYAVASEIDPLPAAELVAFAVDPNHRRMGIGRQLLEAVITRAMQRGLEVIRLQTNVDNEAVKLYESLNFRVFDVVDNYYNSTEHPWVAEWGLSENSYIMHNYL